MPKAEFIKTMFDDISGRYDLLNDILSMGTHRLWKKKLAQLAIKNEANKVLDCATGTGDIAFLMEHLGAKKINAIDFSPQMIELARVRAKESGSVASFEVADLTNLPFETNSFDAATVSFGIRNVENLPKALSELSRVSRSLYILEFGKPKNKIFATFYFGLLKLYFPIFSIISGRGDAYDYLISSSEKFPSAEDFVNILKKHTDYKQLSFSSLFGGIAYIYKAQK
jgi:demethylmenaquinone methyltransferase/2-methoxy-6-polyprenyl-1,4-benzoquinol methylase